MVDQLFKKIAAIMEAECWMLCSQELATVNRLSSAERIEFTPLYPIYLTLILIDLLADV